MCNRMSRSDSLTRTRLGAGLSLTYYTRCLWHAGSTFKSQRHTDPLQPTYYLSRKTKIADHQTLIGSRADREVPMGVRGGLVGVVVGVGVVRVCAEVLASEFVTTIVYMYIYRI